MCIRDRASPDTVGQLAAEVTAGATTDYERMLALQNWFQTFTYSTEVQACLLYTSPSPRDRTSSRMPSSACNNKKIFYHSLTHRLANL